MEETKKKKRKVLKYRLQAIIYVIWYWEVGLVVGSNETGGRRGREREKKKRPDMDKCSVR